MNDSHPFPESLRGPAPKANADASLPAFCMGLPVVVSDEPVAPTTAGAIRFAGWDAWMAAAPFAPPTWPQTPPLPGRRKARRMAARGY